MSAPLYQNDEALHAALAPHLARAAFVRALTELERYGFPKIDPLLKGRYAPAVRAWLDAHAGLSQARPQAEGGDRCAKPGGLRAAAVRQSDQARDRFAPLAGRTKNCVGCNFRLTSKLHAMHFKRLGRKAKLPREREMWHEL